MIVTLTMNPAIDKSSTFAKLAPGKKLRCAALVAEAGGGGINVSKAIKELGGESLALFPAGGLNGELLKQLLTASGINYSGVPVAAATRENFNLTELSTNLQYRFIMPGGTLTNDDVERCLTAIADIDPPPAVLVASGSLPPGVPEGFFARLAGKCRKKGINYVLDTSGKPLELAVKEGVYLFKPSLSELSSLSGKELAEPEEIMTAARQIVEKGQCQVIVVSLGAAGALLLTKDLYEIIPAPVVKTLSTVGAGDSMIGGIIWALEQGKTITDAARFGVACGSAATMNTGSRLFQLQDAFKLYDWLAKQQIPTTFML